MSVSAVKLVLDPDALPFPPPLLGYLLHPAVLLGDAYAGGELESTYTVSSLSSESIRDCFYV